MLRVYLFSFLDHSHAKNHNESKEGSIKWNFLVVDSIYSFLPMQDTTLEFALLEVEEIYSYSMLLTL